MAHFLKKRIWLSSFMKVLAFDKLNSLPFGPILIFTSFFLLLKSSMMFVLLFGGVTVVQLGVVVSSVCVC